MMGESALHVSGNSSRVPNWREFICVLFVCAFTFVANASGAGALDILKATTEALSNEVEQNRDVLEADSVAARAVVRKILTPQLDLDRTSRWVLGKYWRQADTAQKERFIEEFRTLLVRLYASAVADLAGVDIEYLPVQGEPNAKDVVVKTRIPRDGAEPIGVYYRMYNGEHGWKVYDVTIDGVSLVTTYRASFSRLVRTDGMDVLIDRLAEKNRESGQTS